MRIISSSQGRSLVHVPAELFIFLRLGQMLFSLFLSIGLRCLIETVSLLSWKFRNHAYVHREKGQRPDITAALLWLVHKSNRPRENDGMGKMAENSGLEVLPYG